MLEEVMFKKGKVADLPKDKNPGTFYVLEDIKTIYLGDMVLQDTDDVQKELMDFIEANEIATADKIDALADHMVDVSALTKVEEMIPIKTSQLTNDSGFITVDDLPSDLTQYVTEAELIAKNYATQDDLNNFVSSDDLAELSNQINTKVDANVLSGYSTTDHSHDDKYYTEDEVDNMLNAKQGVITDLDAIRANAALGATALQEIPSEYVTEEELNAKGYLTEHQDISGKQDVITDLKTIRDGAALGATALQEVPLEYVTDSELTAKNYASKDELKEYSKSGHSHDDLYYTEGEIDSLLSDKQDVISDIATIRSGAALGATALQTVPGEYITESELNAKGYLTEHQDISGKQDVITDLESIRTNAALGATALQEVPSEYVTESELTAKGYSTTSYVDDKVAALVDGAPDTLNTLNELAEALKDNKDIVTVLENSISSKQDKITDLDTIRTNAALGATALQEVPSEYVTESELNAKGYLTEVPSEYVTDSELTAKGYLTEHQDISGKQDKINDLDAIRSGATLGATALQSVPSEYVTETELTAKGYLTEHQDISGKQDVISDIDTIRTNASLGATALQSIPSEYITESELNAKGYLTSIPSEYITETELSNKGYATKAELTGYTTDAEYNTLVTTVNSKANSSALTNYSTTSHTHGDLYYTETEIDSKLNTKQNVISDLEAIRSGAALGATALQSVPTEYVTETELNNKGYATTSSVNSQINTINQTIGVNTAGFTLADRITKLEDGYDAPDARAKVLWIGTSIPAGDISFSNNGTTQSITTDLGSNNYPKMIADVLGFNLYNNSRGSSFVCFYPSNEDGTANWATASDWSEYSSEVWKGYSLSASFAQIDEKFGPNGLNCPEWLVNNFKSYSYESLIIPYIDGTLASCDTVVIDHGYNDRNIIINEASWHPGEGETQFAVGAGRDWLLKLQDPFETTLETETYFQGKWWNDESVSSKKHYISAIIFLVKKIWAVNPKIKIIIGNYFTSKSNVFSAEFGNDRLGEFVHLANSAIASWLRVNCVEVWHHTGLYNRNVGGVNDYQTFCPDGVHPHSDSTGHSNKVIAGVYINALRGTLYK